jgi:hypothetical protein
LLLSSFARDSVKPTPEKIGEAESVDYTLAPSVRDFLRTLAGYERDLAKPRSAEEPVDAWAVRKLRENGVPDCWPTVATMESFAVAERGAAMLESFAVAERDETKRHVRDLMVMLLKPSASDSKSENPKERQAFHWTVAQKLLLEHLPLIERVAKPITFNSSQDEIDALEVTKMVFKAEVGQRADGFSGPFGHNPSATMAKELDAEAMKTTLDAFLKAEEKQREAEAEAENDLSGEPVHLRQWRKNAADALLRLDRAAAERIFGHLDLQSRETTITNANRRIDQAEKEEARLAERLSARARQSSQRR